MAQTNYVSLFLIATFQFSAATNYTTSYLFVRAGDEVALSCLHVQDHGGKCDSTNWNFKGSGVRTKLIERGQIHQDAKSKADRLSVAANCSLVVSKVSDEDVGLYGCTPRKPLISLSAVVMTEHRDDDEATLNCSVSTYRRCIHTVKWMYNGSDVDEDDKDLKTSQSGCRATVTFCFTYTSDIHDLLTCSITQHNTGQEQRFAFGPQSPPERTDSRWPCIIVAVVSVALLIIAVAVAVIKWKRAKENKTQADHNATQPAREIFQTMVEPEYDVPIFTRMNGGARVRGNDNDDSVIYSVVVTAGSSADPSRVNVN